MQNGVAPNCYRKIGILGGMGPDATAHFYVLITRLFQNRGGAKAPSDFPEMIIESIPMPRVYKAVSEKAIKAELARGCRLLESAGADFIVVPCNTVHKYIGEMRSRAGIPVYSIIEETVKAIKNSNVRSIAVLGGEVTVKEKLYEKSLSGSGIKSISTKGRQAIVCRAISNIMKGKILAGDKKGLLKAIKALQKEGAEGIVLGCTELSLILNQKDVPIPVFDSSEILALATFNYAAK